MTWICEKGIRRCWCITKMTANFCLQQVWNVTTCHTKHVLISYLSSYKS